MPCSGTMGSKLLQGIQVFLQVNKYTLSYRFLYGNVQGCVYAKNRPVSLTWTDYTKYKISCWKGVLKTPWLPLKTPILWRFLFITVLTCFLTMCCFLSSISDYPSLTRLSISEFRIFFSLGMCKVPRNWNVLRSIFLEKFSSVFSF